MAYDPTAAASDDRSEKLDVHAGEVRGEQLPVLDVVVRESIERPKSRWICWQARPVAASTGLHRVEFGGHEIPRSVLPPLQAAGTDHQGGSPPTVWGFTTFDPRHTARASGAFPARPTRLVNSPVSLRDSHIVSRRPRGASSYPRRTGHRCQ